MRLCSRALSVLVLSALPTAVAGCGPFGYLKKSARDATQAVAAAKAAGAEEHSPYEYWGAVSYLEQSKVLMGYSEYQRSFEYADRAAQLAQEAKLNTEQRFASQKPATAEGEEGASDETGAEEGAAPRETPPAAPAPDPADGPPPPPPPAAKVEGKAKAGVSIGGGQ